MAVEASFLHENPYFSNLSDEDLQTMQGFFFEKEFERGDIIAFEGEPAEALYLVFAGAVKILKTSPDGKEQILSIVRPGETFNDVPIFDGAPIPCSAQAMGPVTVYEIEKHDFENILRRNDQVARNVINVLAARVRHLASLVEDLSFKPVIGRVAKILLDYEKGGNNADQKLTQQEMAAIAGTAREVVARSLKSLEDQGTLRMDRHRIVITDKKMLKTIAGVTDD